ncbi:hypothetical protein HMPREF9141_1936 [Prevotella multiformis DSM 16608]|uniref:Uncharacterized protein n=1 Tax=Prevotella multiformis DSM 16608 TaxID=888743 RepID=F0F8L9_9BACT|nr:hypothetical protein HMPREF9141_1936 [Prevotella multiformis DSM 16608]
MTDAGLWQIGRKSRHDASAPFSPCAFDDTSGFDALSSFYSFNFFNS